MQLLKDEYFILKFFITFEYKRYKNNDVWFLLNFSLRFGFFKHFHQTPIAHNCQTFVLFYFQSFVDL